MGRYIWELTKEKQVGFINRLFSWSSTSMTKDRYKMIKSVFKSGSGIKLDDLKPKIKQRLIMKLFYFKFESSCSNAKYVRCGKKKGYEDIEFLLGDWNGLIRNLKKYRPDLVETGMILCEKYIENNFHNDYAPIIHRKHDSGHYSWDNVEIMTRKEHDELTKLERKKKKEMV